MYYKKETSIVEFGCEASGCTEHRVFQAEEVLMSRIHLKGLGWNIYNVTVPSLGPVPVTRVVVLCPKHAKVDVTVCLHSPQHALWNAQTGPVRLCQMTDEHLSNAIQYIDERLKGKHRQEDALRDQLSILGQYYRGMRAERYRRAFGGFHDSVTPGTVAEAKAEVAMGVAVGAMTAAGDAFAKARENYVLKATDDPDEYIRRRLEDFASRTDAPEYEFVREPSLSDYMRVFYPRG